jgi:hypothetical protein
MNSLIDFYKYNGELRIKKEDDKQYIWCVIRKKYLVLQPEELVRQLILIAFIKEGLYPPNLIQVEKGLVVNGLKKRFDIIVYDRNVKPFILVECKSYKITLAQNAIDQAAIYNKVLKAPFLFLTNGITTICASINFKDGTYFLLDKMPELE